MRSTKGINRQEKDVIEKMIHIYCKGKHKSESCPCEECEELKEYAFQRLSRCAYGENKPTCKKCPIHCYKPAMKEKIRLVMKYAGPRMVLYHPVLAIKHLLK